MNDEKPRSTQLGRGLSALLGETTGNVPQSTTAAAPSGSGLASAPVEHLAPSPLQPRRRFEAADIQELADSIRERGILQPILVRHAATPGRYEIIAGERRWRAAQAAQLHEVPIIVRDLDDETALEVALVENVQRQDLNPLEEADGYKRLIDQFGHTQDSLTRVVGKSRSHIANTLRLLNLPAVIRGYVEDGALSAGHARALIGVDGAELIARRAIKSGMSVRQVERLARRTREGPRQKPPRPKDRDTAALERSLSDLLGLKVTIEFNGAGGTLSIRYDTLDQLDTLITKLSMPAPSQRG